MKIPPTFNRLFKSPLSKYGKVLKQEQQRSFEQAHALGASGEESFEDVAARYEARCKENEIEALQEPMILAETTASEIQSINENLDRHSVDVRAREKYRSTYLYQEQIAQLTLDGKIHETEGTLQNAKRDEIALTSKIEAYAEFNPLALKGIWGHPIVLVLIGSIFLVGEFIITIRALETIGFAETYHIWSLAAVFTSVITISAGLAGRLFAGKETALAWTSFGIASAATIAVILLRWAAPQNLVYSFFNVAILCLTTLGSYLFSKDEECYGWIFSRNKLRKLIELLPLKLQTYRDERAAITTHYQSLAYGDALREEEALNNRKKSLKKTLDKSQVEISAIRTYFSETIREGVATVKIAFVRGKATRFPLILFIASSFILAALTGCEFQSEPERREVMIAIDRSTSMLPHNDQDAQKIFNKLSNEVFQLDKKRNHPYGIRVYIADLGSSFPTVRTVELEDGDHYAFRVENDRQEAVTAFSEELKSVLEEAMTTKPGVGVTNVNRGLCYLLNLLVTSDFSDKSKVLYLYSDGIESSTVARFENFYRNPSLLMDKYDELSAVFDADCPISDLTGVEINIVHKPEEPSLEEIVRAVGAFWKRRLEDHNATVKVRSNL